MTKEIVIYILMFVEVILIALTAIQLNICYKKEQNYKVKTFLEKKPAPDLYGIFIPKEPRPIDFDSLISKVTFGKDNGILFMNINNHNGDMEIQFEDVNSFARAINILNSEKIMFYIEFTYRNCKEK